MTDHDDELADAVRELTRTIEDLRQELDGSQRRRRRPRLRPPTPRDVLAFTDEIAIPTALAVLQSSVRALEAFQRGLELVRTEREVRDRTAEATTAAGDRADEFRETTLSRLDTVLSELQRAASTGALPADEDARELLTEARSLRDEVDDRLRSATGESAEEETTSSAVEIDIEDGTPETTDDENAAADDDEHHESNVDVDAELETLKDQYTSDDGVDAEDERGDDDADDETDSVGDDTDGNGDGDQDESGT